MLGIIKTTCCILSIASKAWCGVFTSSLSKIASRWADSKEFLSYFWSSSVLSLKSDSSTSIFECSYSKIIDIIFKSFSTSGSYSFCITCLNISLGLSFNPDFITSRIFSNSLNLANFPFNSLIISFFPFNFPIISW
ncbi:unnamed protein product [Blepharisma stoltei]|uniref:Uncharacterized protein n=1 Tax=Blepharisma stoltei TaxID=1481888 RepID=A0AAU9J6I2_9CILI|nr:unnamed protein product [Blepharisma stoltei]